MGSGTGAAYKDGKLYVWDFGHCSCYGPLEGGPDEYDVKSLDWENVITLSELDNDVRNKVQELLTNKEITMKLLISIEEAKEAVAQYILDQRGIRIDPKDINLSSHVEGDYDAKETIFDGFEVNFPVH
jgi:hypothetical protein